MFCIIVYIYTVNVEIFAQCIFSRISHMVSYARKYDVSENSNHYRLDGIRYKIRENMSTRKGHIGLDARKFSCAKISTFTVIYIYIFFRQASCTRKLPLVPNFATKIYCLWHLVRVVYGNFTFPLHHYLLSDHWAAAYQTIGQQLIISERLLQIA